MADDQFSKGLENIRSATAEALTNHRIPGARVELADAGNAPDQAMVLSISVEGRTESQAFTRDEILDSGQAIDAPAMHKVRMLVSHFVK